MKKVSIIVPVYNAEKTLYDCIYTLVNQTYSNLEIILVNDGSSDNSEAICLDHQKKDERIKYISQMNAGVSSARNKGLEYATGNYVQFVDSDDALVLCATEKLVYAFERWNSQLAICAFYEVTSLHEIKKEGSYYREEFHPFLILDREQFLANFGYMLLDYRRVSLFAPWNKLYLRATIQEHNIKFPEDVHYGEDLYFNLQYYNYCDSIVVLPNQLYCYSVENFESLEGKFKKNLFDNQLYLYREIYQILILSNADSAENMKNISEYFVHRTLFCLENIFKEDSELSMDEKKCEIGKIINTQEVKQCFAFFEKGIDSFSDQVVQLVKKRDDSQLIHIFIQRHKTEVWPEFKEPLTLASGTKIAKLKYGIKKVIMSISKYGVCISINRIIGKILRFLHKRR